jgi:hypothetical protein
MKYWLSIKYSFLSIADQKCLTKAWISFKINHARVAELADLPAGRQARWT